MAVLFNEEAVSAIRTHDILNALARKPASTGGIIACNYGLGDDLKEVHIEIRDEFLKEAVSHNDETNMNVAGKNSGFILYARCSSCSRHSRGY